MDAGHHSLQGLDAEGHPDGTAAVVDEKKVHGDGVRDQLAFGHSLLDKTANWPNVAQHKQQTYAICIW